ncbi:MAG: hypothetical protein HYU97_09760 [Deltaproteobacteria bacterium]|nr:hypothetical protein [Deltaproteobacteria bacterium]
MKQIHKVVVLSIVMVMTLATTPLFAKDTMNKDDYSSKAKQYEEMANQQDAIANEHKAMAKTYKLNQGRFPKATRDKIIADMQKHCEAISTEAQKLASEYRAFAQWHKDRVNDL